MRDIQMLHDMTTILFTIRLFTYGIVFFCVLGLSLEASMTEINYNVLVYLGGIGGALFVLSGLSIKLLSYIYKDLCSELR